jgi:hypothetical protein
MQWLRACVPKRGPCFVAGHIAAQEIGVRATDRLGFCQQRRDKHCRGVAVEGHIIEIEHMAGNAVDERGVPGRAADAAGQEPRLVRTQDSERIAHAANNRLATSRDQNAYVVD